MNKLKEYRKKERMTQKELADLVSITKDYVSIIERGKQTPGFKLAKSLADIFNTTIDDLNFFGDSTNKTFDKIAWKEKTHGITIISSIWNSWKK